VRRFAIAAVAGVLVVSGLVGCVPAPTTYTGHYRMQSGRTYWLRSDSAVLTARPLVVMLHPLGHTASTTQQLTGATPYADSHKFSLVYAEAIGGAWNAGGCCSGSSADDLTYLRQVVDDVAKRTPVDRSRVYVWGYSNGAMMAWRALCQAPDVFAAAGVVGGQLLVPCGVATARTRHVHGQTDTVVPWRGGRPSWCGCTFPDAMTEPARVATGSTVTGTWIAKWGHGWPSNGTDQLWQFTSRYRLAATTPPATTPPVTTPPPGAGVPSFSVKDLKPSGAATVPPPTVAPTTGPPPVDPTGTPTAPASVSAPPSAPADTR
jgi:predicted esterase